MNKEKTRQVKSFATIGLQVIITVVSGIMLALLVSGGTNYQTTQKNAAEVPDIKKQVQSIGAAQRRSDSVATIRYIFDTIRQNRMHIDIREMKQDIVSIKKCVKIDGGERSPKVK